MATTLKVQTSTQILASENWDDDFEFQQESNRSELHPYRRHVGVADARKASITSSALEDWDADEDPTNVHHPSTSQAILHQHVERHTDNWDDDFEDGRNSPKRVINTTTSPSERREESWDDDVDIGEESEDDSAEFGFAEKEEDRTVTAKSRRAVLKRLSSPSSSAPPPMLPPLPTNFLLNLSQQPAQTGPYHTFQQPFPPQSPTSSVFSVPTTVHTHDHYYSSTTHLRPTSAFALLPPSPPIHKERERRRLRKKSRPKPEGTFELTSLRGSSSINASETRLGTSRSDGPSDSNNNNNNNRDRYSLSDEGDAEPSSFEPPPPRQTPTDISSADDRRAITPALAAPSLPQTPGKGSALLSRIGSVKKWGVRRKRASTTPSEVIANDSNNVDPHRTPRVKSSRTSFHANLPSGRNSMSTPPPPPPPPPPRDPTASSSNPESAIHHHHRPSQRSNWFFRASSAGSPHTRAGGRTGGGTSSKGDRSKEEEAEREDQPTTSRRRRSESISRTRSRSRTGRVGTSSSYLNGSRTDVSNAHISVPSTPSRLVKRKSVGFFQLGKSMVASKENVDKRITEPEVIDSPRKERYVGLGLGRASGRGIDAEGCGGDASEHEGPIQLGDEQERRRRKSFSRFLFDRDKENESNASSKGEILEKERDGSRGFMGSVRRISLVGGGKHKRTKSGSGVLVSIGEGGKAPPLPSSSLLKLPSKQLPYLLPLPVTSSQLSLRLPSPSSYLPGKLPFSQTGSMHDLPSAFSLSTLPFSRTASGASSQTQASNTSSVLPPSSVSSMSSRNTTGSEQQTPLPPQRKASTRSRASEESARPRKSTSSRRSLDIKSTNDVNFVTKLSQSSKNKTEIVPLPQQPNSFVVPSPPLGSSGSVPPLLPPIELQPPSPPRTITKGPKPESNPSNILTTFDSNSTSKLSTSASSSSVFFTPSSSPQRQPLSTPSPNSKTNKLHVPLSPYNKSPQLLQQSASLGRATTAGSALSEPPQDGSGANGDSPHPRRNSLGDLKIPARISQAQVGLRRDLGMVKEFANNVEQLKELQRMYDGLVVEIQSILDAHVVRHEQQQAQQTSPIPTALTEPVLPGTTSFLPLKPKKRPRSNTNPAASRSEVNTCAPFTPAQISYNELASAFYVINSKYRITWECAELLIELGAGSTTGNSNDDFSSPQASASAPIASQLSSSHGQGSISTKRGRERAITLAGDESKPTQPPLVASYSAPRSPDVDPDSLVSSPSNGPAPTSTSMSWRTSTGRHDLSQRQVVLLREMLNNARAHADVADTDGAGTNSQADTPISEKSVLTSRSHTQPRMLYVAVNNEWKWGDPKNSTVTLPEDGGRVENGRKASTDRKRRSGKLGMSGLRDLLRALKRGAIVEESATPALVPAMPVQSTTSLSTESSVGSRRFRKSRQPSQRRKPRTGTAPDSIFPATENEKGQEREPRSPYGPSFAGAKPSPRRPSLASVFRLGSKNRPSNTTNNEAGAVPRLEPAADEIPPRTGGAVEDSSSAEEDWDRMDSASDLDTAAKALGVIDGSATVRGVWQYDGRINSPYLGEAPEQSTYRPLITKRSFIASQASIRCIEHQSLEANSSQLGNVPTPRPVRLSNVEEHADDANTLNAPSSMRSVSQAHSSTQPRLHKIGVTLTQSHPGLNQSGSVRSIPVTSATMIPLADSKPPLAMTPENIKPLLENAKEVQTRLGDCIAELRALLSRSVAP